MISRLNTVLYVCVCVVEKLGKFCGNSLLEEGEECDGGDTMKDGRDNCCNKDCTLKAPAVCRLVLCDRRSRIISAKYILCRHHFMSSS